MSITKINMVQREPIPMFKVRMSEKASEMVAEVLNSGMIGEGPKVEEFKQKLEERFDHKQLLLLNSCTSALTLALRLAEVNSESEVISTPFTMIATNVAIASLGARIIWADINEENVNVSVEDIAKKITSRTKAIVVTHVGGVPCEMEEINKLGIPIVSDCAHAIGTYYKGKHISHWADYSCFSFQAIKQLTTGDGGALVVKDEDKYELGEKLKWFGMTRKVPPGMTRLEHQMIVDVEDWGYKFHMNDIAASVGLANLEVLDDVLKKQQENANYYYEHFKDIPGITLPFIPEDCTPSWWIFYLFTRYRDDFIAHLKDRGIVATPMWRRNDEYTVFKARKANLPNLDYLQDKVVFIPVGWWLTLRDKEYIIATIHNYLCYTSPSA